MSKELKETEKAYIAGILDGEGCVSIAKSNRSYLNYPYYQLRVIIAMSDKNVIDLLTKKLGGYQQSIKMKNINHKISYRWQLTCDDAENFLRLIEKYLIVKKMHCKAAFNFRKTKKGRSNSGRALKKEIFDLRTRHFEEMKKLNKRGL